MPSSRHLVDPELLPLLELLPALDLSDATLMRIRAAIDALAPAASDIATDAVSISEHFVPGPQPVHLCIYRPERCPGRLPVLLHMHGGGYVTGSAALMGLSNTRVAVEVGCAVVSVDYRLAPEAPAPAALDDCYAAFRWIHSHADDLKLDAGRVAIGGESAGGGLAAALALRIRDSGDPLPCLQWLIAPMLDDRTAISNETPPHIGEFVWTPEANRYAWQAYLGHAPGAAHTSAYASASRAIDSSRLPAAYIVVGALDLFAHESIAHAQRLIAAGVPTEFHLYPGAYHGFEMAADTGVGRRAQRDRHDALRRAFGLGSTT
jgi:acetyl esterase/lipase